MKVYEYRGIRGLMAAELLTDTLEEITHGTPFSIAGVNELGKETEASSEAHYYDNVPAVVVDSTGADAVTMATSAIPLDILANITGQFYDEERGLFIEGEREQKYFALGYITKRTDGTEVFVWRLKGTFNIPSDTHNSEDDGTDANGQELVFTGINTTHKFTLTKDNKTYKKTVKAVNVEQDKNPQDETTFFATVQTPDTVKKAAA